MLWLLLLLQFCGLVHQHGASKPLLWLLLWLLLLWLWLLDLELYLNRQLLLVLLQLQLLLMLFVRIYPAAQVSSEDPVERRLGLRYSAPITSCRAQVRRMTEFLIQIAIGR